MEISSSRRLKKLSKILASQAKALGPHEARIFTRMLIIGVFSTLGMKKFLYLTIGSLGNPIFIVLLDAFEIIK